MADANERQPLLSANDSDGARRSSVVSFKERDLDNPKEWSTKFRWFSVILLCFFAAVVYESPEQVY